MRQRWSTWSEFGIDLDIPLLDMNGTQIEGVHHPKLPVRIISDDINWWAHILYINSRAWTCIYCLTELKRLCVLQSDLICIHLTLVHPVVEYACMTLESIQKRALRISSPGETWRCMCYIKLTQPEQESWNSLQITF